MVNPSDNAICIMVLVRVKGALRATQLQRKTGFTKSILLDLLTDMAKVGLVRLEPVTGDCIVHLSALWGG